VKQPYEMTKKEWLLEMDKATPDGMPRYFGKNGRSNTISQINRNIFLCFGVSEWLHEKALQGCDFAIEALEYNIYDKYSMILLKAKEEGLI
jgi:hypothetical protein